MPRIAWAIALYLLLAVGAARGGNTVADATVRVECPGAMGSGVCVADSQGNRVILTCRHVVGGNASAVVRFPGGRAYSGRVVIDSTGEDLAAVLAPVPAGEPNVMVAEAAPRAGDVIYAVGYPLGRGPVCTRGTLRGSLGQHMTTDCLINSGNSGGGFFDARGALVGISTEKQVWGNPTVPGPGSGPPHRALVRFLNRQCPPFG